MSNNLLILYTKVPQLGKSKTRLAKESNTLFAFLVSLCSFKDTINKISNSKHYDFIVVVNSEEESQLLKQKLGLNAYVMDNSLLELDQSERFASLFSRFKIQYDKVVLIPSDVPAITESTILEAFKLLDNRDYVFGPEYNGGVYLIGSSSKKNKIFYNVRWSTENSVKDLIKNTKGECALLQTQGDINTFKDLSLLQNEIRKYSPLLHQFISSNFNKKEAEIYAYN
ncbi:MAG: DUF2064 domain-containing protein [Nanoarchaeota archaeon]